MKYKLNQYELVFLIPAYNESKNLKRILYNLRNFGSTIVVNDFSSDTTKNIAEKYSTLILSNNRNYGYNYSIIKGLKYLAKKTRYKYVITFDADGQHKFSEIAKFLSQRKKFDVINGSRNFFNRPSEKIISEISYKRYGVKDPLSGMKLYNIPKLRKKIFALNPLDNTFGMFFLNWGKDVKIFDLKIKVNKKNKISSMDLNNNIETQFLLSFQKIIKKKFT